MGVFILFQLTSLSSSLSTRQLLRIARRVAQYPGEDLFAIIHKACLARCVLYIPIYCVFLVMHYLWKACLLLYTKHVLPGVYCIYIPTVFFWLCFIMVWPGLCFVMMWIALCFVMIRTATWSATCWVQRIYLHFWKVDAVMQEAYPGFKIVPT